MTNEQFEKLQKYETNMRTAIRFSYSRAMTNEQLIELAGLYEEVTGTKINFRASCRQCDRLSLLKKVGKVFFDYKEALENQPQAPAVTATEAMIPAPATETEPAREEKKSVRKRKPAAPKKKKEEE